MDMNLYNALGIVEGLVEADDENEVLEAWEFILRSGAYLTLPGRIGRQCAQLVEEGLIHA